MALHAQAASTDTFWGYLIDVREESPALGIRGHTFRYALPAAAAVISNASLHAAAIDALPGARADNPAAGPRTIVDASVLSSSWGIVREEIPAPPRGSRFVASVRAVGGPLSKSPTFSFTSTPPTATRVGGLASTDLCRAAMVKLGQGHARNGSWVPLEQVPRTPAGKAAQIPSPSACTAGGRSAGDSLRRVAHPRSPPSRAITIAQPRSPARPLLVWASGAFDQSAPARDTPLPLQARHTRLLVAANTSTVAHIHWLQVRVVGAAVGDRFRSLPHVACGGICVALPPLIANC